MPFNLAAMRGLQSSRPQFNPNELRQDTGQAFDASTLQPGQLGMLGLQQEEQRRGAEQQLDWQTGRGLRTNYTNPNALSPGLSGWFGAMQMKENAANAAGKRFGVDWAGQPGNPQNTGFGQWSYQQGGGPSRNLLRDVRQATSTEHPAFQALAGLRRYRG
jgi:hypothetical protein